MSDLSHLLTARLVPPPGSYHWQRRLLEEWFLEGRIPEAVDVPTGLGKTRVIAAWLIARAVGVTLPRRLVYVVDRRAVVDQATTEAEGLVSRLAAALRDEEVAPKVRETWRHNLGLPLGVDLPISTLRGRYVDNRRWMDRPHGAAIVVGTVDMIGSRLLFGGYGVGPHMRSAHAGLLGCDTLVVLDESHLVPTFERLLEQVHTFADADRSRSGGIVPRFRTMALSATGRERAADETFSLTQADRSEPSVRARLQAEKRLVMLPAVATGELAASLADRAWALGEGARRILVFCNSRRVAQAVESDLSARANKRFGTASRMTELFVGERRLRERDLMYEFDAPLDRRSILNRFLPDAPPETQPAFLVATSAAEVGVDLDADDIVCDLVPWERMVQRFGRVNRRPVPGVARIEIVPSQSEKDAEDDVDAMREAELRAPFESTAWPVAADGTRDASPLELERLKQDVRLKECIRKAQTPPPYYPAVTPEVVEACSLTTLRDHPGRPNVAPYLRGWTDDRPQCSVVWRVHFPLQKSSTADRDTVKELGRFFDAAPPHQTELLEAPVDRVVDILKKRAEAWSEPSEGRPAHSPVVVLLDARNDFEELLFVDDLRRAKADRLQRAFADRTLVVDARLGGLDRAGLLDPKAADRPPTLDGDEAQSWGLSLKDTAQRRVLFGKRPPVPSGLWRFQGYRWALDPDGDDERELWVEVWRGAGGTAGNAAITKQKQALDEHHTWARDEAARSADALGLPAEKSTLLCAAAAFHDAGKDRELWQNAMNAERDGRPYAKTTGGAMPRLLSDYRHEFGSLADASGCTDLAALRGDDLDLALHLIAAHHGRLRPSIPPIDPNLPPSHSRRLAQEAALRYARLQRLWGPWGLAWWEALLRAADWAASRRVDEPRDEDRAHA
ncbi:MAG: type I-U CRISPR-associated helicase/endonuclease Cas3 [Candidatus Eremiobacteraeota bacterium]|nr:type I-U CRISPR-associated helicase/endonuclease Cas3 [Candidatus Eremiobacteraeota bacterium]MBC5802638.1 type I-U CRISPR-associated helicase/endonuclease Cas3 [Candidatus Eremiobacteraeota bacterium]MBC5825115.1 type I-U CRISPR-associated helicase/endonuclease Cas3 [Candidatus Eremiobacteraeota bacterium]